MKEAEDAEKAENAEAKAKDEDRPDPDSKTVELPAATPPDEDPKPD